ncbi:hypothetical protein DKT77_19140 [Meridianimarinicoccus roseus]|uniref:Uncharacterized protein n=1 Tax=Meridianimarinicoccus roseus TaxID=2072018 RepID=A0A2V2L6K1_9RHOB|nr:hypothetical protein [Meridianimarinicoccus roseus]PWR01048.1 hypothetical protein DKT77_19140 [Meridianimarinicoccus roseus]
MTLSVSWHPFVTVCFEDAVGNLLTGLTASPLPGTRERLARHALTFRDWPDRFTLYSRRYDARPDPLKGPISVRTRFAFALNPVSAEFSRLFEPDFDAARGPVLYVSNLTSAGGIRASGTALQQGAAVTAGDAVTLAGQTATIGVDLGGGAPDAVEAQMVPGGAVIDRMDVAAEPGAAEATITLTLEHAATPRLRAVSDPAGSLDRGIYADAEILARAPRGIVELFWETRQEAVPAPDGVVYRVVFDRR